MQPNHLFFDQSPVIISLYSEDSHYCTFALSAPTLAPLSLSFFARQSPLALHARRFGAGKVEINFRFICPLMRT